MTDMLIVAGDRSNLLANNPPTISGGTASALRPLSRIYDYLQSKLFELATCTADFRIIVDLSMLLNPSFDTWTGSNPDNWALVETGAGTDVAPEATIKVTGANAAKFVTGNVGGALALASQDIDVRAGWKYRLEGQCRGNGTIASMKLQIVNVDTFHYWNGSTWVSSPADAFSRLTATYGLTGSTFTVESPAVVGKPTTRLRIQAYNDAQNTTTYLDDLYMYPAVDWLSVHWHTWPYHVSLQLVSASDPSFADANTEGTLAAGALTRPSFYLYLPTQILKRSWAVKFVGWTGFQAPPQMGEVFLSQATKFTDLMDRAYSVRQLEALIENETPTGEIHTTGLTLAPRRVLGIKTFWYSKTGYEQWATETFGRLRGNRHKLVIAPSSGESTVILGVGPRDHDAMRSFVEVFKQDDLAITELPFPSVSQ